MTNREIAQALLRGKKQRVQVKTLKAATAIRVAGHRLGGVLTVTKVKGGGFRLVKSTAKVSHRRRTLLPSFQALWAKGTRGSLAEDLDAVRGPLSVLGYAKKSPAKKARQAARPWANLPDRLAELQKTPMVSHSKALETRMRREAKPKAVALEAQALRLMNALPVDRMLYVASLALKAHAQNTKS